MPNVWLYVLLLTSMAGQTKGNIVCPNDWISHDNGCYSFNTTKLTWFKAKQSCQTQNAQLVVVDSKSKSDFLFANIQRLHHNTDPVQVGYWTAGNDLEVEGQWRWGFPEGQRLTFTDWVIGEPNNLGTEDCLKISGHYNKHYHWNDETCCLADFFICEILGSAPVVG